MLKHLGHRKRHTWAQNLEQAAGAAGQQRASTVIQSDAFVGLRNTTNIYVGGKHCKNAAERDAVLLPLVALHRPTFDKVRGSAPCGPREMATLACSHLASDLTFERWQGDALRAIRVLIDDVACPLTRVADAVDFALTLLRQHADASPSTIAGLEHLQTALLDQGEGFAALRRQQALLSAMGGDLLRGDASRSLLNALFTRDTARVQQALDKIRDKVANRGADWPFLTDVAHGLQALAGVLTGPRPAWLVGLLAWQLDTDRAEALQTALARIPAHLSDTRALLQRVLELEGPASPKNLDEVLAPTAYNVPCGRTLLTLHAPTDAGRLATLVQRVMADATMTTATIVNLPGGVDTQRAMLDEVVPLLDTHAPELLAAAALDSTREGSREASKAWREAFARIDMSPWPDGAKTTFKAWCLANSSRPDFLRPFPSELRCPISTLVCVDPVLGTDGETYDRHTWHRTKSAPAGPSPLVRRIVEAFATSEQALAQVLDTHAVCAFTRRRLRIPVVLADGHTYEEAFATDWLRKEKTSPATGAPLAHLRTTPHRMLAALLRNPASETWGPKAMPVREVHFASSLDDVQGWLPRALDLFNTDYYALLDRINVLQQRVQAQKGVAAAADVAAWQARLDRLFMPDPTLVDPSHLDPTLRQAFTLRNYTGAGYIGMNGALRNAAAKGETCDKGSVKALRSLVESSKLGADHQLYRGIRASANNALYTVRPGDIIYEPGFSSTSYTQAIAYAFGYGSVVLRIAYKAHQPALEVGTRGSYTHEREVILPPETRFRVQSTAHENGYFIIDVTIV